MTPLAHKQQVVVVDDSTADTSSVTSWSSSSDESDNNNNNNRANKNKQNNTTRHYYNNNNRHQQHQRNNNKSHHHSSSSKQQQQQRKKQFNKYEKHKFVALDCEMVGVGLDGQRSILARVCIVNYEGNIIYDKYVQTTERVTDYRTFVSGITPDKLLAANGAITFFKVRRQVLDILQGKILIGHGLNSDLKVLNISHPWYDIRDTAKYEPFMKYRQGHYNNTKDSNILWPRKLKDLAFEKLHRQIQAQGMAHSPYEDAVASLDLYKSVHVGWENYFNDKIRDIYYQQQQQIKYYYEQQKLQLQQEYQYQCQQQQSYFAQKGQHQHQQQGRKKEKRNYPELQNYDDSTPYYMYRQQQPVSCHM